MLLLFKRPESLSPLVQGVQYLVENDLLEWRAASVAEFLYKEEGLNKTAIGNFLGERYSFLLNTVRLIEQKEQ